MSGTYGSTILTSKTHPPDDYPRLNTHSTHTSRLFPSPPSLLNRSPAVAPELLRRPRAPPRWEALESATRRNKADKTHAPDTQITSLDELHRLADRAEARIRNADLRVPMDDDEKFALAKPLGTGLVACFGCGRVLSIGSIQKHKEFNCAKAAALLGADGVEANLKSVQGRLKEDCTPKKEPPQLAVPIALPMKPKPKPKPFETKKPKQKAAQNLHPAPSSPSSPIVPKEKRSKKPRKARVELGASFLNNDALAREAREVTFAGGFPGWDVGVTTGRGLGPPGMSAGGMNPALSSPGMSPRSIPGYNVPGVPTNFVPHVHPTSLGQNGLDLQQLLQLQREHSSGSFRYSPQNQQTQPQNMSRYGSFHVPGAQVMRGANGMSPSGMSPDGRSPTGIPTMSPSPTGIPPTGIPTAMLRTHIQSQTIGAVNQSFANVFDADFGTRFDGGKRRRGDEEMAANAQVTQQQHMQHMSHIQQAHGMPSGMPHTQHMQQPMQHPMHAHQMYPVHVHQMQMAQMQQMHAMQVARQASQNQTGKEKRTS